MNTRTLALTAGEPAGIGADLCVALAQQPYPDRLVILADRELLLQRARQSDIPLELVDFDANAPTRKPARQGLGVLEVWHHPMQEKAIAGQLNPANSQYVLDTLKSAAAGCLDGTFDALVTAPVHKGAINDAGIPFTGHTEFLADLTHTSRVVMMLVGGSMRVALATTHLPLRDVANAITQASLEEVIRILHRDLVKRFALLRPRILVAGLNPHAGEGGHLGREELDIMIPVLDRLRAEGMDLAGPLPADTLFTPRLLAQGDCVLAMYHDQGLPVLKHASFGGGVNVTLGLPFIRTSVDHGTALDLAGTSRADSGSLLAALKLASSMARP